MTTSTGDQREINWDIDINPSMFCTDQFPPLADHFPCMSSSSSSSSNPAPAVTTSTASSMSSSTSSAASWAVLQAEGDGPDGDINPVRSTMAANGSGSIDCMDVMDLIDGNEMWDPSSIFEQNPLDLQQQSEVVQEGEMKDGGGDSGGGGGGLDELGSMFFEWLKSNKELISAEDMKKIKLKKSTVECASKRLGSSQEGKKQLLKLILEWVQQHQLQRKNSGSLELHTAANTNPATLYPSHNLHGPVPPTATPPPTFSNGLITPQPWIPPYSPYMVDQAGNGMGMVAAPAALSYMGGGYDSSLHSQMNPYNNTGSGDYQALESAPSWTPSQISMAASPYHNQFPDVCNNYVPHIMPLAPRYSNQFSFNFAGNYAASIVDKQRLMRLGSSATKEARKKRMARQRRTYFHHHHHSRQSRVTNTDHHPQAMLVDDTGSGKSHVGNWLYWPSTPSTTTLPPPPPPPQMEVPHQPSSSKPHQPDDHLAKQISSDKLQGLNTEKNLKFLLQKVLKQSDVGSLGRIVMPKKEAESHLPDLDSRDGITIPMEDIGTSQVWNMRYRFWPNNKSRMYLLENTGDFVKANGLQEGDFIVLYSNVKCGKYLIRGVKVRQPVSAKSEGKKPVKRINRSSS